MTIKRIIFGIEVAVIVSELIIIYAIKFCWVDFLKNLY